MKDWLLGRGQTLISLVVVVALVWGLIAMILKLQRGPQGDTVSTLSVILIGVVTSLVAVATALGKALIEPKKEDPKP